MTCQFKRGDLIKADAAPDGAVAATATAATEAVANAALATTQYWFAYHDKSIGLVTKANADHVWIRWFGSARSDQDTHKYYNKTEYIKLISRNGQL